MTDDASSELVKIMEQVEDLPIKEQQETFEKVIDINAQFQEQQRIIAILEALSSGEIPQEP